MTTEYTLISRFRNKEQCEYLIKKLEEKGRSCYNFCDAPPDPGNPNSHPEEQMKFHESTEDFFNSDRFKRLFERDLAGMRNAQKVILLLPAGISAHIEAGIAFGMGKHLILIGEPEKPETLYLIFNERYSTIEDFINSLRS